MKRPKKYSEKLWAVVDRTRQYRPNLFPTKKEAVLDKRRYRVYDHDLVVCRVFVKEI